LAAAGTLLSLALEWIHQHAYRAVSEESFCSLGAHLDCNSVALSRYAVLLGVPVALWGCVGFIAIGLAAWQRSRWLLPLAGLAVASGVALSALSGLSIGAWCLLCELAHAISVAIALLAWRIRGDLLGGYAASRRAAACVLPPLGLLGAFALFLPRYWAPFDWRGELPLAHGRTVDGQPWIGAEQPKLTLEEFVDYSCPHCKAQSAHTLTRLAAHPRDLRIVRRFYPRTMCEPKSETRCLAPRIALCADEQDRFWQADRWLFEHASGGALPSVSAAARDIGLDGARLAECVSRDATFEQASAAWRLAKKLHVPGTPYYADGEHIITATAAAALIDAL
jgi:uncharacterized membrane protein